MGCSNHNYTPGGGTRECFYVDINEYWWRSLTVCMENLT